MISINYFNRKFNVINRCHPELSMELLIKEKNTWLCIYFILHNDAWKHRMQKCHNLAKHISIIKKVTKI